MSDMTRKEAPIFSDKDKRQIIEDMGFKTYERPTYSRLERIQCRLFGPHDWVPLMSYDVAIEKMTEEGAICERCHKETQWNKT